MRRLHRVASVVAAVAAVLLAGCAADKPKPTALESFTPKIAGRQVWAARVDSVQFPLMATAREGNFYVAGSDGTVVVLDATSGLEQWRASAGAPLSAGVGSDGRFVSVVTRENMLVVLQAGRELWRKRLPALVTTAPLVAGERVFVLGVDRAVTAFDAQDGRQLWTLQRPGDALTLAQSGVLLPFKDTLVAGLGGRMVGIDPTRGSVRWEVPLATPRGTNEVERLADLIGPAVRQANRLCARAFQVAVACVDAERGSLLWTRNAGGIQAVAGDAQRLYGADASDRLAAWKADSGELAWTHERLLYRGLSGGLAAGKAVVFGDAEGFVHFLDPDNGATLLRLPTDGSAIVGTPVLSGTTLLVATRKGGLFAFRPE